MPRRKMNVDIRGKQYTVSPPTLGMYADLEQYVKEINLRTFLNAATECDSETKSRITREIVGESITDEKRMAFMRTLTGTRYMVWCSLKTNHPEIKLGELDSLIDFDNYGEIMDIILNIEVGEDGGDEPKNPTRAKAAAKK